MVEEIIKRQLGDDFLNKVHEEMETKQMPHFHGKDQVLNFRIILCVPNKPKLKKKILEEAHSSKYAIHLNNNQMYQDLKLYWWLGMRKKIAEFCPHCLFK